MEAVGGAIDFGVVVATAITSTVKQVTVTVLGVEDDDGDEQRSGQILYGNAAVLFRPVPKDNGGACEVVFVRSGDEMVPVAHRDTRWQVDLSEGEVAIRAFGDDAARITLKPDGTVIVDASEIKLGSASATDFVALASLVDDRLTKLQVAHDSHIHTGVTAGTVSTGAATVLVNSLASVACEKTRSE